MARDELTGSNKGSSSSDSSSNTSSGSSSGEDGDRQRTATDSDFGDSEISVHTKSRHDTYLQNGELPDDNKIARRLLLTKDNFVIWDDKLLHIGVKRCKNNATDQPIVEQLCIPQALQPMLLARYHVQLMHCGYEKMYLTLKEHVYWDNMYTDIPNFVAQCETCHVAKANQHPIKANIQSRDVPPEIFQRVHMDHVKIAVKNATHRYAHALVLIDANSLCCELIPVKNTSAAETCRTILREG